MIIILGSTGFLGAHLQYEFRKNSIEFITIGRSKESDIVVDPLDFNSVKDVVLAYRPEVLINLVAITDVDYCEQNPKDAMEVHVSIPFLLSNLIKYHELLHHNFY